VRDDLQELQASETTQEDLVLIGNGNSIGRAGRGVPAIDFRGIGEFQTPSFVYLIPEGNFKFTEIIAVSGRWIVGGGVGAAVIHA